MSVKTFAVGQVMQLIELNKNNPKYDIDFFARSTDDFLFLVIDQAALDSGKDVEFRTSRDKEISGNIKGEDGAEMTYYLALKSLSKNLINVEVSIVPRPVTVERTSDEELGTSHQEKKVRFQEVPEHAPSNIQCPVAQRGWNTATIILIGVVGIGAVVAIYLFYTAKKKRTSESVESTKEADGGGGAKSLTSETTPGTSKNTETSKTSETSEASSQKKSLLSRLKKLPTTNA
jgi:hypothetical protein